MGCGLQRLLLALAIVLLYFLFLPQGPDMLCQLRNSLLSRHTTVGGPQLSGVCGGWTSCPSPTGRSHVGQVKHLPPFCEDMHFPEVSPLDAPSLPSNISFADIKLVWPLISVGWPRISSFVLLLGNLAIILTSTQVCCDSYTFLIMFGSR